MHKATIEIEAPPERIFAYLTDPGHARSWQPEVVETHPLPAGGLKVGAQFGATLKEYGRRFDVKLLVAAMKKNEHIAYRVEAPASLEHVEYSLVQWGAHTRVITRAAVLRKGFLRAVPLLKGLLDRLTQWRMESRLRLLRRAVESHA